MAKQKNHDAFHKIYDKYASALYCVILQIVKNEEAGNAVLYKVFLNVWLNINSYNSNRGKLFTWMFQIARNIAINETKLPYHKNTLTQSSLSGEKETSRQLSAFEIDNSGLKKVLQHLDNEQQIVFDLCYYKGFTNAQIAKTLSIPEDIIKIKIRIALFELRTLLGKKK